MSPPGLLLGRRFVRKIMYIMAIGNHGQKDSSMALLFYVNPALPSHVVVIVVLAGSFRETPWR